jgi:hypothetical protein
LGKLKRVSVSDFRGMTLIDIREYYLEKSSGEFKPGKKGIALTLDQWEHLKKNIERIDKLVETHKRK